MGVGTNENVKDINEKIQDFEKFDNCENICSFEENTKELHNENVLNSSVQESSEINQENAVKQNCIANDVQETQKIALLDELIKDTENSILRKSNLDNIQSENSQIENLNEVEPNSEKIVKPIANQNNVNTIQINSENVNTIWLNPEDIKLKTNLENTEKKHKEHFQDKKDYRLEKMLFDRINAMQGKIKESLELIKKFERINAKEENLPNIVTTLHDKLTQEVIKQFRTVGIEFNMKSYLVQSIVSDLLNKFEDGITEFKDCSENLNFVREVQDDFESRVALAPTSKVKNIFARLRGLFKPERRQEKLEQLERERQEKKLEEANIHLIKYKFKNSELERYTIRNNIIDSLTREILYGPGSGLNLTVSEFINEKITPELSKLGLQELLPKLEDELFEEYKDKQENISKEEFLNIQVGEVKKIMKSRKIESIRSKINNVNSNNSNDNESEDTKVAV